MSLLSNLLLIASLAALSLAACTGENPCQTDECLSETENDTKPSSALDLIRVEIEVLGTGTVVVEGDEAVRCTGEQGLCSFSYTRGTDLIIYAEDTEAGVLDPQDGCQGQDPCYINLDFDQVVVANFQDDMPGARQPSKPTIIVEPIPSWYRDYAQQTFVAATITSAE